MKALDRCQSVLVTAQPHVLKVAGQLERNPIFTAIKQAFAKSNFLLLVTSLLLMIKKYNDVFWHSIEITHLLSPVIAALIDGYGPIFILIMTWTLGQSLGEKRMAYMMDNVIVLIMMIAFNPSFQRGNLFILGLLISIAVYGWLKLIDKLQTVVAPFDGELAAWRNLINVVLTATLFLGLGWLYQSNLSDMLFTKTSWVSLDQPIWVFILVMIEMLLWYMGINGYGVIAPFVFIFAYNNMLENFRLMNVGRNAAIIYTPNFWDYFLSMSGAGIVGALVVLCLFSRQADLKQLGKAAFSGSLFSVSEPMIYGLPLTMNKVFLLPFVGGTALLGILQWYVFHWGWVALPAYHVADLPLPFSILLATLDWRSLLLMIGTISLAIAMYYPAFRYYASHRMTPTPDNDDDDLDLDF